METDRYISFYAICQNSLKGQEDGPGSTLNTTTSPKEPIFTEIFL